VLQRCCSVAEALASEALEVPALHESLADVRASLAAWMTWSVRRRGRRRRPGRSDGGWSPRPRRYVGRWLLRLAEDAAPADVEELSLHTGARNTRNITMYERAGYRRRDEPDRRTPSGSSSG
jgi:tRNA (guanine37-N1)-methyltransferase